MAKGTGTILVHATHEAVGKVGGIGAVLHGFFTCNSYLESVERSIIVSPLFSTEGIVSERLGEDGEVLYSSLDGFARTEYASVFQQIEQTYNAGIIYGRRTFVDRQSGIKSEPEVLLIDVRYMDNGPVNELKKQMFEEFGVRSNLYENLWEYEQYVRMAPAAIAAVKAIGAAGDSTIIVAHEFMGMPTALAAIVDTSYDFKTAFYAHEVATMRRIVETYPGHDTMFYNAMKKAHEDSLYVNDVFGEQSSYFKHPLVEAARYCDTILAVGDYTAEELRFLRQEFENADINVVYNGIPAYQIGVEEKLQSKEKLQRYCENLLGYRPDVVFTHVTRLIRSKGLWRDLNILKHIEKEFRSKAKTGVMFLLSTEVGRKRSSDIYDMELKYGWPVAHREGMPDLSGGEADFYTAIQEFNARSSNIKVVFINQFGFERRVCGKRMPEGMEFMDIRRGSDVEFGLSVYEPFGISQLEPLTFGGLCVFSSVCGCGGFVRDVSDAKDADNIIVVNYTDFDRTQYTNIEDMLQIDRPLRDRIEDEINEKVAMKIIQRLPKDESEIKSRIQTGYQIAKNMSWDVVVKNYLLESLQKILNKQHHVSIRS